MLVQKCEQTTKNDLSGNLIIMDNYDRAEHRKLHPQELVLYLSVRNSFRKKVLRSGISAASSHNILTWLQMIGSETAENLFPVLKQIYIDKKRLQK